MYKLWRPGVDSLYNSICNDGVQTVDVADFMNDADPGGYWQFVGFIRESDNAFLSEIDMYIDGVLTTLDILVIIQALRSSSRILSRLEYHRAPQPVKSGSGVGQTHPMGHQARQHPPVNRSDLV